MNEIDTADTLIQQGVDEFKLAAAKTATGIIEQGLAVLKIKNGCEKKQGGSDFPDVAMRELGLSQSMAVKYACIGKAAEKLIPVGISLPGESVSTLYHVAMMDENTIADKIARGIISPSATRDQVTEKKRVQTSTTVHHDDSDLAADFSGVLSKLKPAEQKILKAQFAAEMKVSVNKAKAEAKKTIDDVRDERADIDKARAQLRQARKMVQDPFTAEEFKKIRGMLHPDKHPDNQGRAKEAFELFIRIEPICKKRNLKAV